jgi:hypothetical protein
MKRIVPLAPITLGILLSFAAFGQLYRGTRAAAPDESSALPAQIAGLDLSSSESGEAAISEFTNMHGKEFPVTSGSIAYYGNGRITLWLAGTDNESVAADMVSSMQARIAEGNSPFTPIDEIQNNNRKVYILGVWGKSITTFNRTIWSSGLLQIHPSLIKPYNESWRSIHEKITYAPHASLLPGSSHWDRAGFCL